MPKTVSVTPLDISEEGRGKVSLTQYRALEKYLAGLASDAPEIWDGKPFTLDGKTWKLVAEVSEE